MWLNVASSTKRKCEMRIERQRYGEERERGMFKRKARCNNDNGTPSYFRVDFLMQRCLTGFQSNFSFEWMEWNLLQTHKRTNEQIWIVQNKKFVWNESTLPEWAQDNSQLHEWVTLFVLNTPRRNETKRIGDAGKKRGQFFVFVPTRPCHISEKNDGIILPDIGKCNCNPYIFVCSSFGTRFFPCRLPVGIRTHSFPFGYRLLFTSWVFICF